MQCAVLYIVLFCFLVSGKHVTMADTLIGWYIRWCPFVVTLVSLYGRTSINVLSNDDTGDKICGFFVFCRLNRNGCADLCTVKLAQGQHTALQSELLGPRLFRMTALLSYEIRHCLTTGKYVRDTRRRQLFRRRGGGGGGSEKMYF